MLDNDNHHTFAEQSNIMLHFGWIDTVFEYYNLNI